MPLPKKLTARAKAARIDGTHRCPRDRTASRVMDMRYGFLEPGASLEVSEGRAIIEDDLQDAGFNIWQRKFARLRTAAQVAAELSRARK
jgi:hypothetical protein